jgi:hypothetical protein
VDGVGLKFALGVRAIIIPFHIVYGGFFGLAVYHPHRFAFHQVYVVNLSTAFTIPAVCF